jgi:hypothetical protein
VWRDMNFANAFGALRTNVADVFARSTGGRQNAFLRQKTVERLVSDIGGELHNQYLLTFTPHPDNTERFHRIRISVPDRPELSVRSRAGYWPMPE